MVSKRLRWLKKMNMLNSRIFFTKMKSPFMIYAYFERALVPTDNGKQNPNESWLTNIKNMLPVVMVINYYVLIINLVNLLNHT